MLAAGALALAACSAGGAGTPPHAPINPAAPMRQLTTPISHVVFIIQENRSFNNLFLNYPGATTAKLRLRHERQQDSAS